MFIPPKKAADKRRFFIASFLLAWYNEIVMDCIFKLKNRLLLAVFSLDKCAILHYTRCIKTKEV